MDRQVDVKALVSHLVRGDGLHKCRICMGDTSEGQVFLGDTVMNDGDRPVTLAELLETITGVEVPMDDCLPSWLCAACSKSSIDAANFITMCRNTTIQWENTLSLFSTLPPITERKKTAMFAVLNINKDTIHYFMDNIKPTKSPALRLSQLLSKKTVNTEFPFSCLNCGKKFRYPQHYFQHLKESTDLKRACHVCAKVITRDELVQHLQTTHKRPAYDCKKCPAISVTYKTYLQHNKLAHAPGACTCGDCGRSFKTYAAYHGHSTVHSSKSCPGCQKNFRNHTCYLHHVKKCNIIKSNEDPVPEVTLQKDEKDFKSSRCICDYCGKSLAGKKFIQAHIQNVHIKSNHRTCNYCGKLYHASYMAEHIKSHQNHKPAYLCQYCKLTMKTKLGYIQHLRLHTGEKPFECKHCGEKFSASSRRSYHIAKVHNNKQIKKHICVICGAQFRLPSLLRKHVASACGANKINKLQCTNKIETQNEHTDHQVTHKTFKNVKTKPNIRSLIKIE